MYTELLQALAAKKGPDWYARFCKHCNGSVLTDKPWATHKWIAHGIKEGSDSNAKAV